MPPLATSNSPTRCSSAPVNAPLRWPNSSLSISVSGSAPQLIATNGIGGAGSGRGRPGRPVPCRCRSRRGSARSIRSARPVDQLADLVASAGESPISRGRALEALAAAASAARYLLGQLALLGARASAAPRARPACTAWSGSRTRRAAARRWPSRVELLPVSTTASVSGEVSLAGRSPRCRRGPACRGRRGCSRRCSSPARRRPSAPSGQTVTPCPIRGSSSFISSCSDRSSSANSSASPSFFVLASAMSIIGRQTIGW